VAAAVRALLGELNPGAPLPGEVALRRGSTGEIMVIFSGDADTAKVNRSQSLNHAMTKRLSPYKAWYRWRNIPATGVKSPAVVI